MYFIPRLSRRPWQACKTSSSSPFLFLLILCLLHLSLGAQWLGERSFQELSTAQIASLISTPDPTKNLDTTKRASHLSKILIPRPPDTDNNTQVKNYIVSTMRKLDWDVEEDSFTEKTPYGMKRFTNVIATKDPEAPRKVVVAAHFDSKFFPEYPYNQFVGATDSAVPCALMLDLAEALDPLLTRRREQLDSGLIDDEDVAETTLQLIFFDGEEAFHDWTSTDSVYGARHLAEKWEATYIPPNTKRRLWNSVSELSTIEHLILLDLLGAKDPLVQSFFLDTAWLFDALVSAEKRLGNAGAFVGADNAVIDTWRSFFAPRRDMHNHGFIEDDHIPFMQRGVSILHVITNPFPHVWHTLKDDASALDLETMKRWNLIMRVFMCEYLGLQPDAKTDTLKRDNGELLRYEFILGSLVELVTLRRSCLLHTLSSFFTYGTYTNYKMASRARHPRTAAPVRFATDDGGDDFSTGKDAQEDGGGDDNMEDMIAIMQEFQKKKSMKTSSRGAALTTKKNALLSTARKEADVLAREGRAYIEQCKARIVEMKAQETAADEVLKDAMRLWSAHEESFQSLLSIYPEIIEDLSPRRAQEINAASEMLETHPHAREASRRRLMKNARKSMEAGIESQKLATDASALIKHYKALLLS
ncbi:hypothetical protein M0805_006805 [Coniferiporia weirii]|nr:hypothetical protein M0805_006805 [Coniferiporia weirii]